jgi:hypothetical protein
MEHPAVALTVVAGLELLIQLIVPEFRLRVWLALSNDLKVQLALDLAIEDLQLLVFDGGQIFRKALIRGEMQFVAHRALRTAMPGFGPRP